MAYDIGPKIGIEGEAEFRKAIREVNASLKTMTTEMKAVTSAYDKNDNSAAKLSKQNEVLGRQVEAQRSKLMQLSSMLDKSKEKYGENDEKTQKWKQAVNHATAELNNLERELQQNTTALKQAQDAGSEFAQAQEQAERAAEELRQEQARLASQVSDTSSQLKSSADAMSSVNKTAIAAGIALTGLSVVAGKVGADFEAQMSKVEAISGATAEEVEQLKEKAEEMGATTKFSATQSAEALEYMAMAGWKANDMVGGLEGIMNLAAASGEELGTTSDIVTDALTAFGLKASDSGHFADVLAVASSNANTNVSMMGDTFKYAAPVAGALGYSVEDVAVAIGIMANAGIKGEQAGTALRGTLTNLSKPSEENAKYIKRLGISMTDASGDAKSLNVLLTDMRKKFANLTETQKAQYAAGIAGKNAMSGLLALMNGSDGDFDKLTKAINNSDGASKKMADTMNKNLKGQLALLKSEAEGVGITFYEKIDKQAAGAVEKLSKKVGDFGAQLSSGALDNKLKAIGATATAAGIGLVAMNGALAVKDIANFATAARAGTEALKAYSAATKAGAAAQGALNLVQSISPMGVIAIAATTAVAGLAIYKNMTHEATTESEIFDEKLSDLSGRLEEQRDSWEELKNSTAESFAASDNEISKVEGYVRELDSYTDAQGHVSDAHKARADYLMKEINTLIPNAVTKLGKEKDAHYKIIDSIDAEIFAKKKAAAIDAMQEQYNAALAGRVEAQGTYTEALNRQIEAQQQLADTQALINELQKAQVALSESSNPEATIQLMDGTNVSLSDCASKYKELANAQETWQQKLDESNTAVKDAKTQVDEYNTTLDSMDMATAAENQKQLDDATAKFSANLCEYAKQDEDTLTQATQTMVDTYARRVSEVQSAQNTMTDAQKEYANTELSEYQAHLVSMADAASEGAGSLMTDWIDGINQKKPNATTAMKLVSDGVLSAADIIVMMQATGCEVTDSFAAGLLSTQSATDGNALQVSNSVGSIIADTAKNAETSGGNVSLGMAGGIRGKMDDAVTAAKELASSIANRLRGVLDEHSPSRVTRQIGAFVSQGMALGITDKQSDVEKATESLAQSTLTAAKHALDIHSPSRVMRDQVGRMIAMGVSVGIEQNQDAITGAIDLISKGAIENARDQANGFSEIGKLYVEDLTYGVDSMRDKALQDMQGWISSGTEAFEKQVDAETKELTDAKQKQIDAISDSVSSKATKAQKAAADAKKKALKEEISTIESNAKEQKQAHKDAAKEVTDTYKTALTEGYDEALQVVSNKMTAITKEAQSQYDEIQKNIESMQNKLSDSNLYELDDNKSYKLTNWDKEAEKLEKYNDSMSTLKKNLQAIGAQDFLAQVTSLSEEEAGGFAEKLNSMSETDFTEYITGWQTQQQKAKAIAEQFYSDQLETLNQEFTTKLDNALSGIPDSMNGIGINSIQGMINGMYSKSGALSSTAKEIVTQAIADMKQAAGIHSPSRVTRDLIGKNLADGISVGLESRANNIANAMKTMLSSAMQGATSVAENTQNKWLQIGSSMAESLGVGFTEQMHGVAQGINRSIPTPATNSATLRGNGSVSDENGATKLIQEITKLVSGASQQSANQPICISVDLDGTKVARKMVNYNRVAQRNAGVSLIKG